MSTSPIRAGSQARLWIDAWEVDDYGHRTMIQFCRWRPRVLLRRARHCPLVVSLASTALLLSCPTWAAPGSSVQVTDLRCEYLREPQGLDVSQPRLGWKLVPTHLKGRGQRQTAYQVWVASSTERLAQDRGDRWDSGEVASDESTYVVYQGQPLRSGDVCWWQVRVKDEHGAWSAWSARGRWTVGLIEPGDWSARCNAV